MADLTAKREPIEEHRVTIKLTAEEVAFIKWCKEYELYERKSEGISFNQTLTRMLALQLREDMDTYRQEAYE